MKNQPDYIDKRYFTCESCAYSAQVYGEMYFDHGCRNYFATFHCRECKTLFESLVSEITEWDTPGDFIYDLKKDVFCLRCGSLNTTVWNRESGKCPECKGEMYYKISGKIKLRHG